ncbi:ABC transporter ATP-binding protein/permease [Rubripirellula amarantea]|uniref:Putative ABC transporter ATP-binding protein n=1 Tax=Rubripirellula amarantea TaxID=2527999 RepID=A0A5C5WED2_9BACT|nr:ABC transporter ATP-binding protein [Rubripirellula amarantea]MDA8745353.1 ABC transporter ATP-binding protein/permease [Rubripirellula amarantea]TWT49178.1 putative ABC transporter ATP-binding protein [Rubripirellula amarantea]
MSRIGTLAKARHEPAASGSFFGYVWATLAGLLVPVLVVLVGLIAVLLNSGGLTSGVVRLGTHCWVPVSEAFASQSPLVQLFELVGISLLVSTVFSLAIWLHRLSADARARSITKSLHQQILKQSLRRAEVEGAAAQAVQANHLIGEHLPQLQRGLSLWYRAVPRSVITLVGCVALALLVNVWLAMVAVVSGVLIARLVRQLRRNDDSDRIRWEVPRARARMAELVGQAPLHARLQSEGLSDQAFASELESLYRRIEDEDHRLARIWPLLFLAISASIAVLVSGLAVNVDAGLSLPSALVIGLALGATVAAAGRLMSLSNQLTVSSEASNSIYHYLQRSGDAAPSEQRVGLAKLRESVDIQDVTLGDITGDAILRHLSLKFTPGSLVAMLGTDSVATQALLELLMGFGMPNEGRITIDGINLRDIHPQALAKNVMWIGPDGPIYDGTIEENLRGNDTSINNGDMVKALEEVDVYERLFRLPEGLNTVVSASDAMLGIETTYAVGVARALLHKPSIVLAAEPPPPAEHLSDDRCLAALRRLQQSGSLVIILPRRLQTLRSADRVVLLNGPRLVGEGKHAELLSESDLYRHLNYLLFNPYRHNK